MENLKVLVVDDQEDVQDILKTRLEANGYDVPVASDKKEAIDKIEELFPELVLLDIRLPNAEEGMEVLRWIKNEYPEIIVIMITAHGSIQLAVDAMKIGAYDFVEKPFDPKDVKEKVDHALERHFSVRQDQYLRSELKGDYSNIRGKSRKMMEVLQIIDKVAPSNINVLITGETGTGKELIALAIHQNSPRRNKPYIRVNCAAIPEELIENELFGHEKGAYTGADTREIGMFEKADKGTIFLDEIGDMSQKTQAKVLRVLQDGEFERIGVQNTIKVDVRVVSATNKNIDEEKQQGRFREDLYYRIGGMPIHLPPLRERREDIRDLTHHFIHEYNGNERKIRISPEAERMLTNYEWTGNIRELQNCIKRILVMIDSEVIRPEDLPEEIKGPKKLKDDDSNGDIRPEPLIEVEKKLIVKTLEKTDGNITQAAKILGMARNTLLSKMRKYEIK